MLKAGNRASNDFVDKDLIKKDKTWVTVHEGASQVMLLVKNLPANAGDIRDAGVIPRLGRFLTEGHGNPLQYSCLENPMDSRAWQAMVQRVTKSQTRPRQFSPAQQNCQ